MTAVFQNETFEFWGTWETSSMFTTYSVCHGNKASEWVTGWNLQLPTIQTRRKLKRCAFHVDGTVSGFRRFLTQNDVQVLNVSRSRAGEERWQHVKNRKALVKRELRKKGFQGLHFVRDCFGKGTVEEFLWSRAGQIGETPRRLLCMNTKPCLLPQDPRV